MADEVTSMKVGDGDAILVIHRDGTYTTYIQDKDENTLPNILALGVGWSLESDRFVEKLLHRTMVRINRNKERIESDVRDTDDQPPD